jgi:hypothetical protein
MVAFDPSGSLAIFLYVIGALVLVGTFLEQQFKAFAWIRGRLVRGDVDEEMPPVLLLRSDMSLRQERAADLRILEIVPTGGGSRSITFRVEVANYGTQRCRATVAAEVAGRALDCRPATLDLLPDGPVEQVMVDVPRPELGNLVPEFNHDPTLYDETLQILVTTDSVTTTKAWTEHVYTLEENFQRYHIQQRKWRIARGEETPGDRRAEHFSEQESPRRRRKRGRYWNV